MANPRKAPLVLDVLTRNRARLLAFLEPFLASREGSDEGFKDEKAFLLDEIRKLPAPPDEPPQAAGAS